jgi:hypothetical protein
MSPVVWRGIFDPSNNSDMKTPPTFDQFKKTFTNGAGDRDARFIAQYGDVSFEAAYPVYVSKIMEMFGMWERISLFEKHLQNIGTQRIQSNVSESRYYYYNGIKYRFSSHRHPAGAMTSDGCVDFACDPHLIYTINF